MEPSLVWTGLGPRSMALVLAISGHQYQVNNGLRRSPVIDSDSGHYPQLAAQGGGEEEEEEASWPLSSQLANL